jgi:hypothetical protein
LIDVHDYINPFQSFYKGGGVCPIQADPFKRLEGAHQAVNLDDLSPWWRGQLPLASERLFDPTIPYGLVLQLMGTLYVERLRGA